MLRTLLVASFALAWLHPRVAPSEDTLPVVARGVYQSEPVTPHVFQGDLRHLPRLRPWKPGDPMREGPVRRRTGPEAPAELPGPRRPGQRDPLLDLQEEGSVRSVSRAFSAPSLNFEGISFTGVFPPDTVGEVGIDYYIQMTNGSSGSPFVVFDKTTGVVVAGPSNLSTLWTAGGPCAVGRGDPVVLFDQLAQRWLMSEFAFSGNHLCVYISQTSDPVSGGWFNYDFAVPQFPDYPKYAVWPDAYYVSANESVPAAYALERDKMLAGLPATFQRLSVPRLPAFGFQTLVPSDLDGLALPPGGSPNFFMRHRDDEAHDPFTNDPNRDFLELWEFHVDFATPASSTLTLAASIPVSEFESELCGLFAACIPQPGTGVTLDPLREVVMWRLQYRNFGTHQTLVGNFVTDADGGAADHGGIRWFELRRVGAGAWSLFQEGTFAPDSDHRWMGSIAMDGSGNIALGYSVSSATTFPGIRYVGRADGDPSGVMTTGETVVIGGSGSQTVIDRWGDYSSMNVDPLDDCTFWYTTEYVPSSGFWRTRIVSFRFPLPTCTPLPPPVCGNGSCDFAENDLNCAADCGCASGACGGQAPFGCSCDELCVGEGDCCADACSTCGDASCPDTCGNNLLEPGLGEECDGLDDAACPGRCLPPGDPSECRCAACGDGDLNQTNEECDDGNNADGDGCSACCQNERVQDDAQQRCIVELNKGLRRLTKAQAKDILACLKDSAKGKLGAAASIEECVTLDRGGKVAKAETKARTKATDRCAAVIPDFGATDPNSIRQAAITKELTLVHAVFGSDLDARIFPQDGFTDAESKCQLAVAKALSKCQDKKVKEFVNCKKNSLKGKSGPPGLDLPADSICDLERCMGFDPKGKLAETCGTKVSSTLQKKCSAQGVSLSATFGGGNCSSAASAGVIPLTVCLDALVECRLCLALNAADGLARDCDDFDDGTANDSCP